LARLLQREKRWADAEGVLRDILTRDPYHADGLRSLVSLLLNQRRAVEALPYAERLTSFTTKDSTPWYLLGLTQQSVGDMAGAKKSYEKALEISPTDASAQNALQRLPSS
jgi:Flp pilus assembly protein TadD